MDIKLKILSYRKSPGRQKTAKRSPASSDRHPWRYCLVFRRRRLSHASPSQARDTRGGVSEQVPLQTSITESTSLIGLYFILVVVVLDLYYITNIFLLTVIP